MRFLHTADWHVGATQHPQIYKERMIKDLIDFANRKHVDFVLCSGDLYDKHKPPQQIKDYLIEELLSDESVNWIFTLGNHDYETKAKRYHSLKNLQILDDKFPNVSVLEPGAVHVAAFDVANIVCGTDAFDFKYKKTLRENGLPVVGSYHGFVPWYDVQNGTRRTYNVDDFLNDRGLDYLALGDIHKNIKFSDRCWYPGALVQKTYGCECGFIYVELDENKNITSERVQLDLPKKITLDLEYIEGGSSEEDIIALVKKDIPEKSLLKIKFNVTMPVWAGINKDKIRDELSEHLIELVIEHDPVYGNVRREHTEEFTEAGSLKKEIVVLINSCRLNVDKDELIKTCARYIDD